MRHLELDEPRRVESRQAPQQHGNKQPAHLRKLDGSGQGSVKEKWIRGIGKSLRLNPLS